MAGLDGLRSLGEDPVVWQDIALTADNWTWWDLQAAPAWVVDRVHLWTDTVERWKKRKLEEKR